ncbi:MAG: hypothetical protein NW201_06255 [Gemmatimonadales bacterium]|nr:hypothetical protein [Gemmatimonadales bacterium]
MRRSSLLAIASLLLFGTADLAAQAPARRPRVDRWQITLQDGTVLWDLRLRGLSGDRLRYTQAGDSASVSVEQVKELRLLVPSEMRMGQPMGGALGALTGADDETYDFGVLDLDERLRTVRELLKAHPPQEGSP